MFPMKCQNLFSPKKKKKKKKKKKTKRISSASDFAWHFKGTLQKKKKKKGNKKKSGFLLIYGKCPEISNTLPYSFFLNFAFYAVIS